MLDSMYAHMYVSVITPNRKEETFLYSFLRPLIFKLDPETAHHLVIRGLSLMQSVPTIQKQFQQKLTVHDDRLVSQCLGLTFPNPIGLAAGFDKHAHVYPGLAALGFGFVEVGTLTPRPQTGNPKPRIFRFTDQNALINRMGFNNDGIEKAKSSFTRLSRPTIPIGINLGKNKDTPNEQATADYLKGLSLLYPDGDYFVINVSSPNTKGLRELQESETLQHLLTALLTERTRLAEQTQVKKPILLKIAPDLSLNEVEQIVETALSTQLDGIIATNTTLSREGLHSSGSEEAGGLSGKPLTERSTEMIRSIYRITKGRIPIIGVGGIFTGQDAYEKLRAGANLVQIYTSMIYRGPFGIKAINQELLERLEQDQISSITEIIGIDT